MASLSSAYPWKANCIWWCARWTRGPRLWNDIFPSSQALVEYECLLHSLCLLSSSFKPQMLKSFQISNLDTQSMPKCYRAPGSNFCHAAVSNNNIPYTAQLWKPLLRQRDTSEVLLSLACRFVTVVRPLSHNNTITVRKWQSRKGEVSRKAVPPGWFCCPGFRLCCLSDLCIHACVCVFVCSCASIICQVKCCFRPSHSATFRCLPLLLRPTFAGCTCFWNAWRYLKLSHVFFFFADTHNHICLLLTLKLSGTSLAVSSRCEPCEWV